MTLILVTSAVFLAVLCCVAVFNIVTGPRLKHVPRGFSPETMPPRVSILVPARNEERNIRNCLESLLAQDYPNYSITVLDDQSEDETARIVEESANSFRKVRLIEGTALPDGWIGKSWACMQLATHADGDIFLFTDADTTHERFAVSNTVSWMQRYNLGLFSAFSQQQTVTMLERLVIPFIDMLVYALLPLRLVYLAPFSSIAGANGQWIAFSRHAYAAIGGHTAVKGKIVEDIELSRVIKRHGFRAMTAAGTGTVYCRMYRSSKEVWEGFSKNFYAIAGNNVFIFTAGLAFFAIAFLAPYVLLPFNQSPLLLALIGANVVFRAVLSVRYGHPLFASIVLHPIAVVASIVTAVHSFIRSFQNRIIWKDRSINLSVLDAGK